MATGWGRRVQAEMQNHQLGKTPATTPLGVVWIALNTGDPGDDGQTSNEATGVGYVRVSTVAASWTVATLAQPTVSSNIAVIIFAKAGGDWSSQVPMTHFSMWNHPTDTDEAAYMGRGLFTEAFPVLSGETPRFLIGSLRMRGNETP